MELTVAIQPCMLLIRFQSVIIQSPSPPHSHPPTDVVPRFVITSNLVGKVIYAYKVSRMYSLIRANIVLLCSR